MSSRSSPLLYYVAGAASSVNPKPRIVPSPLSTHDASALARVPYPPSDYIPGARDVATPYGNMRIYEFGPVDASRKVLLVHGISTPCVSLAGIASGLADKGYRVMLLDLFGRGWSDAPGDLRYDDRLYTSQLFMALASSPLSWTRFSIIGYSMGGAIGANFTSWFPALVDDLVLLAPAGLIRPAHRDWRTRLVFSGILPDRVVANIVKNRLRTNPNVKTTTKAKATTALPTESGSDPIAAEVANTSTSAPVAFGRPIDPEAVARWQMDHHAGFVPAFISSFGDAPVREQHERWRLIAMRLDAQRAAAKSGEAAAQQGLRTGKVLMVLGKTDKAVFSDELEPDAKAVFGDANLEIKVFDAGHEVPITYAEEIVDWVVEQWEAAR
jgi:pimeloyl-ACP methyl ester carboxylesterase